MRVAIVLRYIFVAGCAARASNVYHYDVKRGSDLEKELGCALSVQDAHNENDLKLWIRLSQSKVLHQIIG